VVNKENAALEDDIAAVVGEADAKLIVSAASAVNKLRAERGAEPLNINADAVAAALEELNTWECKDAEGASTTIDKAATCAPKA
jgi:uncharacterized protein YkwD